MASRNVHSYHCICASLILATSKPLDDFPTRQSDGAHICIVCDSDLPGAARVMASGRTVDSHVPMVLRLEDGFEKRYFVQCKRCELKVGYKLDASQFDESSQGPREDVMYVLPGALVATEELKREAEGDGQRGGG